MNDVFEMWIIYDHPLDFPDHFVVRCWQIGKFVHPCYRPEVAAPTSEVWLRPNLEEARDVVYGNHPAPCRMERSLQDDPCIVEVWI